jgi:hypothetical protein
MSDAMGIHTFYCYQIGWFVFATLVSFLAGLLFWNKGESLAKGRMSKSSMLTYKLTGAGAIFVVALFLFYWINPLKPLSDYRKILIIYGNVTAHQSNPANPIIYTLDPTKLDTRYVNMNPNDVVIGMTPYNFIYSLSPTLHDYNTFKTLDAIPPGNYRIAIKTKGTGNSLEYQLNVP